MQKSHCPYICWWDRLGAAPCRFELIYYLACKHKMHISTWVCSSSVIPLGSNLWLLGRSRALHSMWKTKIWGWPKRWEVHPFTASTVSSPPTLQSDDLELDSSWSVSTSEASSMSTWESSEEDEVPSFQSLLCAVKSCHLQNDCSCTPAHTSYHGCCVAAQTPRARTKIKSSFVLVLAAEISLKLWKITYGL